MSQTHRINWSLLASNLQSLSLPWMNFLLLCNTLDYWISYNLWISLLNSLDLPSPSQTLIELDSVVWMKHLDRWIRECFSISNNILNLVQTPWLQCTGSTTKNPSNNLTTIWRELIKWKCFICRAWKVFKTKLEHTSASPCSNYPKATPHFSYPNTLFLSLLLYLSQRSFTFETRLRLIC